MKNKYKFTILLGLVMSMFTWGESFAFVPQMSVLSGKTVSVIAEGTRKRRRCSCISRLFSWACTGCARNC